MNKKYRMVMLLLSTTVLMVVGFLVKKDFSFITNDFWFTSGALLLVLLSLVDQPFFSKDSSIFVNAVTAFLSLILIDSNNRGTLFWTFFSIIIYLILSSYFLMMIRSDSLSKERKSIQFFSRVNRVIGRPEAIFSTFLIWGAINQFSINSKEFNLLLLFWIVYTILNIPELANLITDILSKKDKTENEAVAEITAVQSENIYLARMALKQNVEMFSVVVFKTGESEKIRTGRIIEQYILNDQKYIKIFEILEEIKNEQSRKIKENLIYLISDTDSLNFVQKFIGTVSENSNINTIRFNYASNIAIKSGDLIQTECNGKTVLYQIVNGVTKTKTFENKNEISNIVGEAIQLGVWNNEKSLFENYGWTPKINSPVYLAENIDDIEVEDECILLGKIPNTNYPVIANKELLITHHTAVLGITGTGKSVFTRNLIKNIVSENTKCIVIDLTGEYAIKIPNIKQIINNSKSKIIFDNIEIISNQTALFKNQRTPGLIEQSEKEIYEKFTSEIDEFIKGDNKIGVFDIPEISNSENILEYTKFFFSALFKYSKTNLNIDKRICIVLEEAHTIVPEYNSMGVADNASRATVNTISQIALQGRKYNIGFIVIAQRTANVSKTVLTQCNSIITFQELDKTSSDFLSNYLGSDYLESLNALKPRNAIAVGKAFKSTVPMIFEVPNITETEEENVE